MSGSACSAPSQWPTARTLSEEGKLEVVDLKPLSTTPFEITYSEDAFAVEQRYRKWLEDALILGLDYWQQSM